MLRYEVHVHGVDSPVTVDANDIQYAEAKNGGFGYFEFYDEDDQLVLLIPTGTVLLVRSLGPVVSAG